GGRQLRGMHAVIAVAAVLAAQRLLEVVKDRLPAAAPRLRIRGHALELAPVVFGLVAVGLRDLGEALVAGRRRSLLEEGARNARQRLRHVARVAGLHAAQVFDAWVAMAGEEALDAAVGVVVEENAVGAFAVAAGAARLLVVRLDAARHLVVDDEADVG